MTDTPEGKRQLRSKASYGKLDRDGFIHRSWMKSEGLPDDVFDGRPVIGICNTWSQLTPCNMGLRDLAEHVSRGVWEAGGLPLEFPAMSLGETQMRPTAMLFRNLLAMEVEESIRGNPIDGVVLLGGCDKTTPGQLMGAASVDLPTMVISSGPMLNGKFKGKDIGSGTDVWRFSEEVRAGQLSLDEFMQAESGMSRSPGTCMTMGTASTMACLVEAMGLSLPYNGTIPAVDSRRRTLAHRTGRRIVEMVREGTPLSRIATRQAFENAIKVNSAIGGSTNAVLHVLAIAGRLGIELTASDFDRLGQDIPLLVDLMPAGRFLMEEFHYAGGVPAVMGRIRDSLHLDALTVAGTTLSEAISADVFDNEVIREADNPVQPISGIWALHGNLAPKGAAIKPQAASPHLLRHRGRAVVFHSIEDFKARIDDPDLDIEPDSIMVLRGCGPKGYPGMPEVGNMPLPAKLLAQGVRDMVRISDARMSGTAYGTVILHVAPESAADGPIGIVEDGDEIAVDAHARTLDLLVPQEEIERRLEQLRHTKRDHGAARGYAKLYIDHVLQADQGCDFDFLLGKSGHVINRESH
ncbi:MAG: IlvD/Edd family dehydratase [Erythrobacter sp.]|nr:IlvD/Edd family dehydratase [Erythrobacter sp.]MDZ4271484.1 IlvD/Edd family dehydratase [Erythrobacter sp.]